MHNQATTHLLHVNALFVGVVLEYELLQQEKRLLMRHTLPHLHQGAPRVVGVGTLARVALLVVNNKLHREHLLQPHAVQHFLLDGQLHFQPFGMRLRPDEAGVHELDLGEAIDFLEAHGQQLARLEVHRHPRRSQEAVAAAALVHHHLLGDALRNVLHGRMAVN